jgi:hypothetical protein
VGFDPDSFSGLATNDTVSVNGWVIETDNGILDPAVGPTYTVAQTIALHPAATF